jgi:hypothetical protein
MKQLSLVLILTCLTGCAHQETKLIGNNFCRLYTPVCYNSSLDTKSTVHQIEQNEVVHLKLCPKESEAFQCPSTVPTP